MAEIKIQELATHPAGTGTINLTLTHKSTPKKRGSSFPA